MTGRSLPLGNSWIAEASHADLEDLQDVLLDGEEIRLETDVTRLQQQVDFLEEILRARPGSELPDHSRMSGRV